MSDTLLLRIGIAVALSLLFGAIIYFGRGRKGGQGRRVALLYFSLASVALASSTPTKRESPATAFCRCSFARAASPFAW